MFLNIQAEKNQAMNTLPTQLFFLTDKKKATNYFSTC